MLLTHANSRLDVKLVVSLKKESGKLYGVRAQSGKVYSPQPSPPPSNHQTMKQRQGLLSSTLPPQFTKKRSSGKVCSPQPSPPPLKSPNNEAAARFTLHNPPHLKSPNSEAAARFTLLNTPPPPPNHQTTTLLDSRYAPGVFVFHHGRRSI